MFKRLPKSMDAASLMELDGLEMRLQGSEISPGW
jgi:hypothetical protein